MIKTLIDPKALQRILRGLERKYGRRKNRPARPIADILLVLLMPGIGETLARRAVKRLRGAYVDWNEVRISQVFLVREKMGLPLDYALAQQKAKLVVEFLREVFKRNLNLDIESLLSAKPSQIRAFLSVLDSVAKEHIPAIMLTAFRQSIMPVNKSTLRILQRTGVAALDATPGAMQRELEELLTPPEMSSAYWHTQEHARKYCTESEPNCKQCPLRGRCAQIGLG